MSADTPGSGLWSDASLAAALFAVDPFGSGGIVVRAMPGPVRDTWMDCALALMPADAPVRKVPLQTGDGRLLGGLDLAATLQSGQPVAQKGVLAEADGGVVILPMAERITRGRAAMIAAALDTGQVVAERDGMTQRHDTHFGVIALDEGLEDEERTAGSLSDRLAFYVDLQLVGVNDTSIPEFDGEDVLAAQSRLGLIAVPDDAVQAVCAATLAMGIASGRAPVLALKAARASAALHGRDEVDRDDIAAAARLVLGHRATMMPSPEPPPEDDELQEDEPEDIEEPEPQSLEDIPLDDMVLEAALAAIPPDLLALLSKGGQRNRQTKGNSGAGDVSKTVQRGRPIGVRSGDPRAGARLNVLATVRAAAPWQRVRMHESATHGLQVRRDDFRITRFKQQAGTTTIFVVDASGSTALNRLAEAKGAVELLLAECYVRRDNVALIAFRNQSAEILLPPTRSLVRAKRSLAGLPGGGATPLASAIQSAAAVADSVKRAGDTPLIVVMTDGRANIALDGNADRTRAQDDAKTVSQALRQHGYSALVIDTSRQPHPQAQALAEDMGAIYCPLPYADAATVSGAVKSFAPGR